MRLPSLRATSCKVLAREWPLPTLRAGIAVSSPASSRHPRPNADPSVRCASGVPRPCLRLDSKAGLTAWRSATPPHLPTQGTRPSPAPAQHDVNDSRCLKECQPYDAHHDQAHTPQSELSQRVARDDCGSKGKKKEGTASCESNAAPLSPTTTNSSKWHRRVHEEEENGRDEASGASESKCHRGSPTRRPRVRPVSAPATSVARRLAASRGSRTGCTMLLLGPPWRPLRSGIRVDVQSLLASAFRRAVPFPATIFATVLASLLSALAFALVVLALALVVLLLPRWAAVCRWSSHRSATALPSTRVLHRWIWSCCRIVHLAMN